MSEDRVYSTWNPELNAVWVSTTDDDKAETLIINGHELRGELILTEGLGSFMLLSPSQHINSIIVPRLIYTINDPETQQRQILLDLDDPTHRRHILKLSILAIRDQSTRYQGEDFYDLIRDKLPDNEAHKVVLGSEQLKNELIDRIGSLSASLLDALSTGTDQDFYDAYVRLLESYSGDEADSHASRFKAQVDAEKLMNLAITQLDGTTLLYAYWIKPILHSMWEGDIYWRANKTASTRKHQLDSLLDAAAVNTQEISLVDSRYVLTPNLWLDNDTFMGLSPQVVEQILGQHKQSFVIDLVKLLLSILIEDPTVQRTMRFPIPGRYKGLAQMLHDRYGVSKSGEARAALVDACYFLNALRYGTGKANFENFVSIGGLKGRGELWVHYLEGFFSPIYRGERLVPILNHPAGQRRSRPYYNRLGLALSVLFVDKSDDYLKSNGAGVHLDDEAITYLYERSGFGARRYLDKALKTFEEEKAVIIENNTIRLGSANQHAERLILEGAEKVERAKIAGRRSAAARKRKLKK